jgi:hypothetical protein
MVIKVNDFLLKTDARVGFARKSRAHYPAIGTYWSWDEDGIKDV